MKNLRNVTKRYLLGICVVGLLSILLSSCIKNQHDYVAPPVAVLSVTQASTDAPPVDFYLDVDQVNHFQLNYANTLKYFNAYTGNRNAIFYAAGTMNKLASDTIHLNPNTAYSLFLANSIAKPDFILLTDSISRPANGFASIRFVDVSPDAPAVDLAVTGGSVLSANKSYKGFSSFAPLAGDKTYNFEIRRAGTTTVLATLTNVNINSGFIYTIYLHGLASSTTTGKLAADLITNTYYY